MEAGDPQDQGQVAQAYFYGIGTTLLKGHTRMFHSPAFIIYEV